MLIDKHEFALFLDFDGTLVDFAHSPGAVEVSEELRELLQGLLEAFGGALAVISGRSIASLDELVRLPELPVAGGHGAEWRLPGGEIQSVSPDSPELAIAAERITSFADSKGLLLEDKSHSLALHFRQKPELETVIDQFLADNVDCLDGLRVIYGNCVREIQPLGVDKGKAVAQFMRDLPYKGRRPCYLGDDTTDEDAFAWVKDQGGVAIKVGSGSTCASQRLGDTGEVLEFLRSLSRG